MSWNNLKLKDIWKLEDTFTKKEYLKNYYIFKDTILPEYINAIKEKGLEFHFSKDLSDMSIQDMSDELKEFCRINCVDNTKVYCRKE